MNEALDSLGNSKVDKRFDDREGIEHGWCDEIYFVDTGVGVEWNVEGLLIRPVKLHGLEWFRCDPRARCNQHGVIVRVKEFGELATRLPRSASN